MKMLPLASLALVVASASCIAAATPKPVDRLTSVTELYSLTDSSISPWHLKFNVTVFDDKGQNPNAGTVEVWHAGKDSRIVTTLGASTLTRIEIGGKVYRSSTGPDVPYSVEDAVQDILHPGPTLDDLQHSKLELRKQNFGKLLLDCVMVTRPDDGVADTPLGFYPAYCLQPGDDRLIEIFNVGGQRVDIIRVGKFLNHEVPMKFNVHQGAVVVLTADIVSLGTYTPSPGEFNPTPGMHVEGATRVPGVSAEVKLLTKVDPNPPERVIKNQISGEVTLHIVIGGDGRVRSMHVVSSPASDLTMAADLRMAAMEAVRQWTFKPYRVNGDPVEVDTTISISFTTSTHP